MDWLDNLDNSTSSQISKSKEKSSLFGQGREPISLPKDFLKDFFVWHGVKAAQQQTDKNNQKKAIKMWHQLAPKYKLQYSIKKRVQASQKRKLMELALKKRSKEKPLQDGIMRSNKLKPKRKVNLVEPSVEIVRPKMIARRPTPHPSPKKRKENRSKRLPKFVPYRQKSSEI
ncbi:uncharacterized protein [Drosophila takahashii]|uniref:uncharacterized protein n=1 Tax=Drosophila takahashii TaxID=29030 RepID=UPI003899624D